jgi:hypothetical protein
LRCAGTLEDSDLGVDRGGLADDPEHRRCPRERAAPELDKLRAGLPVNGTQVEVPHMHFFHYDAEGRLTDLWHVWNTLLLARQLGAPAPDLSIGAPA